MTFKVRYLSYFIVLFFLFCEQEIYSKTLSLKTEKEHFFQVLDELNNDFSLDLLDLHALETDISSKIQLWKKNKILSQEEEAFLKDNLSAIQNAKNLKSNLQTCKNKEFQVLSEKLSLNQVAYNCQKSKMSYLAIASALKNASKEIEPDFKTQQNASLDVAQFNIHVLNEILTSNEIAKDHLSFALFAEDFQKTNKCKELFYKEDLHNKESPITFSCFPKDNQYYSYGSNTPIDEWMTQIDSNINKHLPKLKNIKSKNLNTIESLYLMDQVIRDLNENLPYYLSGVFWVDPITEGNIINPFDQNIKISKEKLISALKREQNYIHNLHQNNTVRFNNAVKSFSDLKAFSNKKSSAKGYFAFERATLNKIVDESIDLLQTYPLESLFATIASKNANFLCDLGSLITDQKKSIALRNSLMTTFGFGLTLASIHPMVRGAKALISTKGLVVGTKEMALRKVSDFKNLKNLDIKAAIKSSPSLLKKPKTYEGSLGPGLTIGSYSMNNEELNQRHISNIEGSRTSPFYNQGGQSFKLFDSMSSQETLKNEMITSLATTPSKLASLGYGTSEILNMVNSPDIGGLVNFKNSNHFSKEFCSKHKSTTVSYMCSKKYFLDK